MNKHVDIKLETAFGNGAGCRLEPAEVVALVEERRKNAGRHPRQEAETNPLPVRNTDPFTPTRGKEVVW